MVALVLGPSDTDKATVELGGKWSIVYSSGAKSFEIILTLLIKVVAFYMRLTLIDF